eukprot:363609-Chlamydomonas_euryale.AAC.20
MFRCQKRALRAPCTCFREIARPPCVTTACSTVLARSMAGFRCSHLQREKVWGKCGPMWLGMERCKHAWHKRPASRRPLTLGCLPVWATVTPVHTAPATHTVHIVSVKLGTHRPSHTHSPHCPEVTCD